MIFREVKEGKKIKKAKANGLKTTKGNDTCCSQRGAAGVIIC
ncbi:hypothetical protein SAMN04487825_11841 [Prevotella sp. kh1p2]|nr:hypothetical protein SAMN04487825_11841 [Prevotella sp. kh1p2]